MSIKLSDSIRVGQQKPVDDKYYNGLSLYASTTEVNSSIDSAVRYVGLTVAINDGSGGAVEYWYKTGIQDADLVIKQSGGTTTFTDLTDTPSTYTGQGGKLAQVNSGESALEFSSTPVVDSIQLSGGTGTEGTLTWNNIDKTADLDLAGVTLQIGQEEVLRVVNKTAGDLSEADFRAVRVRLVSEGGAQGQRLAVVLAQADSDINSATAIGIVTEDIALNQEGFVTISGNVNGIDTTGAKSWGGLETWADGDILYLSPDHAGYLTNVKPLTPGHLVVMGYVVYAHATQGKIFVKVDNGYELEELHDVLVTDITDNELLQWNAAGPYWENRTLAEAGIQPATANILTGVGTQNYIPKFTSASAIGNSLMYDDGSKIGIGTTTPQARLQVNGVGTLSTDITFRVYNTTTNKELFAINALGQPYSHGQTNDERNLIYGRTGGAAMTGGFNTLIGHGAGLLLTTGFNNTYVGGDCGRKTTTGSSNVFMGYTTGLENTTGYYNTFIGRGAGQNNTTGYSNTYIGYGGGGLNILGIRNVTLGDTAANYYVENETLVNLTNFNASIFIGAETKSFANNQTNEIVIGDRATGLGSNTIVLGNKSVVKTALRGQVTVNSDTVESSAQFQIESDSKGFLPPRMSETQRDDIASPVAGLMIYNLTTNSYNVYNGTSWDSLAYTANTAAVNSYSEIVMNAQTNGVETPITDGVYLTYDYKGTTIYRFLSTALNANGYNIEDSFYATLSGGVLSNKIVQRNA